jgi:serine protease Do
MGGLAVATLPHLVSSAQAQQGQMRPISGISSENMATLRALDNSFASLAQYIEPSVVKIESTENGEKDMMGRRMGEEKGVGTGVIYRPDGWILTNDHVVAGFSKVQVDLSDGRTLPAKVIHEANSNDLAVIKIDATDLPAAQLGDSATVRPGQFAMAVGAPFNMDQTVTVGHISALGRVQTIPDRRAGPTGFRAYSDLIQTDTPINMGNSGGPLINVDGQVIGINSAIFSETGSNVGIGFAIPSNQARMIANELIEKGSVTIAYLGLDPKNVPEYLRKEKGIDGGAVVAEQPANDEPAGEAGLMKDDIILRVGSMNVRNQQDVRDAMFHYEPGSSVDVEVLRGKDHKTLHVKLGDKKTFDLKHAKAMQLQGGNQGDQGDQGDEMSPFGQLPPEFRNFGDMIPRTGQPQANHPHTGPAKLGVTIEALTPANRSDYGIADGVDGAIVTSVAPGSVAEGLGISAGTVIEQIGSTAIHSPQDVYDAMKGVKWGDSRDVTFEKFDHNSRSKETKTTQFN